MHREAHGSGPLGLIARAHSHQLSCCAPSTRPQDSSWHRPVRRNLTTLANYFARHPHQVSNNLVENGVAALLAFAVHSRAHGDSGLTWRRVLCLRESL